MAEKDFHASWPVPESPTFLPGTSIEVVRAPALAAPPLHALFDFDGTLSLVREGWVEVMVPMMVEVLAPLARLGESLAAIESLVREFVVALTGKQTIYQMQRLVEEIEARGGKALAAQDYKDRYQERLMARIASRIDDLASRRVDAEAWRVPGAVEILGLLVARGVTLHIASGTDQEYVVDEARLIDVERFASGRIHGALREHASFSKELVIKRILEGPAMEGGRLLGFGDGYVEIADTKAAGGLAIAVASDEAGRSGKPDPAKRARLIAAGADIVVPDFREAAALVDYIWSGIGRSASLPGAGSGGGADA